MKNKMENKTDYYDSDYKLQLYEIHGVPKGLTKEDFVDECKKIIAEFEEHRKQSDLFLKEYSKEREFCPKCGERNSIQTLAGYTLNIDKKEEYQDRNRASCVKCGDTHLVHDRVNLIKSIELEYIKKGYDISIIDENEYIKPSIIVNTGGIDAEMLLTLLLEYNIAKETVSDFTDEQKEFYNNLNENEKQNKLFS